jgi:hypothetical protein
MSEETKKRQPSPGSMAWLVGEALRAGGIKVHQTKEKFGSIRVYVSVPNNHEARLAYREVYLNAMWACPELADNLRTSADHTEWLYETEAQLDNVIAGLIERAPENVMAAWDPRFKTARALILGQDTTPFNTNTDDGEE